MGPLSSLQTRYFGSFGLLHKEWFNLNPADKRWAISKAQSLFNSSEFAADDGCGVEGGNIDIGTGGRQIEIDGEYCNAFLALVILKFCSS